MPNFGEAPAFVPQEEPIKKEPEKKPEKKVAKVIDFFKFSRRKQAQEFKQRMRDAGLDEKVAIEALQGLGVGDYLIETGLIEPTKVSDELRESYSKELDIKRAKQLAAEGLLTKKKHPKLYALYEDYINNRIEGIDNIRKGN